jgi:hypothetical protein
MSDEVAVWEADNIEDHLSLIKRQVDRSLADPETRRLAVKIAGGNPDDVIVEDGVEVPIVNAWGMGLYLPISSWSDCSPKDAMCEIEAVWNFVVANIRYVLDPDGFDLFSTLKLTLDAGAGDCDDMVIAFGALLRALGFQNVFCRVVSTNNERWEHVYTMVGLPKTGRSKKMISLDPTVKGAVPGWEYKKITHRLDYKL